MAKNKRNSLSKLPLEILNFIYSGLDIKSAGLLAQSSKLMNDIFEDRTSRLKFILTSKELSVLLSQLKPSARMSFINKLGYANVKDICMKDLGLETVMRRIPAQNWDVFLDSLQKHLSIADINALLPACDATLPTKAILSGYLSVKEEEARQRLKSSSGLFSTVKRPADEADETNEPAAKKQRI